MLNVMRFYLLKALIGGDFIHVELPMKVKFQVKRSLVHLLERI